MKDYVQPIVNQVRTQGKKLEIVDLSEYKGEEFNIKMPILDNYYVTVRASTSPVIGREGKFVVGLSLQEMSKINTNEKE